MWNGRLLLNAPNESWEFTPLLGSKLKISHKPLMVPDIYRELSQRAPCYQKNTKRLYFDATQRNAYFAHSENFILAMLQDERQHIR